MQLHKKNTTPKILDNKETMKEIEQTKNRCNMLQEDNREEECNNESTTSLLHPKRKEIAEEVNEKKRETKSSVIFTM